MKKQIALLSILCMLSAAVTSGCSGKSAGSSNQQETSKDSMEQTSVNNSDTLNKTESSDGQEDVEWPEKAIQVIIPMGAGGDTDLNARLFSSYLEKELGVSVVCNNVTGGGGVVGSREAKDSDPDGYSLLFFQYASLIHMISGTADFSYIDDFDIAGIVCHDKCYMWIGNGKYETITDLIEAAKAQPGTINIGLSGTGNMSHYVAGLLKKQSGAEINLIDLGSTTECQAALLSGQIDAYANYYATTYGLLESGDFNVMGVYSDKEHELLPGVPTMKEMGYDCSFLNDKYYYFAFPKGTPEAIVEKFSSAMKNVCENPEAQKDFWDRYYVQLDYMGTEDSKAYMYELFTKYEENKDVFDTEK